MQKERITKKNSPNVTVCGDKGVKRDGQGILLMYQKQREQRAKIKPDRSQSMSEWGKEKLRMAVTTNAWEIIEYYKNGKSIVEGKIDKQVTIEVTQVHLIKYE